MKPIIGIVARPTHKRDRFPLFSVHEEYQNAILKAGGIPFVILPSESLNSLKYGKKRLTKKEEEDLLRVLNFCDGILIPGGDQIYAYDEFIYSVVLERKIPFLGICMGMQVMVGEENLTRISDGSHDNKEMFVHKVRISGDSLLWKVFLEDEIIVNSRHKDCVLDPLFYLVGAISSDGVVESLEFPGSTFHIGVEWHPESMVDCDLRMLKLFQAFVQSCKR